MTPPSSLEASTSLNSGLFFFRHFETVETVEMVEMGEMVEMVEVDEEAGECGLQVIGDPGTTFKLLEL